MSEEIIPQNNNPISDQQSTAEKKKEQIIPTWVGIIVIVALIGAFIFLFFKFKKVSVDTAGTQRPLQTDQIKDSGAQTSNGISIDDQLENQSSLNNGNKSGSNVNIDYEIEKMDKSIDSVNESDFNSSDFSDNQIGL